MCFLTMYCTVVVFAQAPQAYCLINYYYTMLNVSLTAAVALLTSATRGVATSIPSLHVALITAARVVALGYISIKYRNTNLENVL